MQKFSNNLTLGVSPSTFLMIFIANCWCCQAVTLSCSSDSDCSSGAFCDRNQGCVRRYYSSCMQSSDCDVNYGECVFLSQDETLSRCTYIPGRGQKGCFCAPRLGSRTRAYSCELNTFEMVTSFDVEQYCVPCNFIIALNGTSSFNKCSTIYSFQKPPAWSKGSYFHSCDNFDDCIDGLYCRPGSGNMKLSCAGLNNDISIVNPCFCVFDDIPCTVYLAQFSHRALLETPVFDGQ